MSEDQMELGPSRKDKGKGPQKLETELIGTVDDCPVYRLLNEPPLGGGTFGVVARGFHSELGLVALKYPRFALDRDAHQQIESFKKEAENWRRLDHPNVLQFLGVIERPEHSDIWLISALANEGPLPDYIRRHPTADRLSITKQLATGLGYLHNNGLVHGDVKASNVLVSGEGQIKLSDFGLMKLIDTNTTTSLQGAGSLRWQAPELLEAGRGRTYESDVYAFGMTVFEVLNGNVPFVEYEHQFSLVHAIVNHKRPPTEPMTTPDGQNLAPIWDIVEKCWSKDPQLRPDMRVVELRLQRPGPHPGYMIKEIISDISYKIKSLPPNVLASLRFLLFLIFIVGWFTLWLGTNAGQTVLKLWIRFTCLPIFKTPDWACRAALGDSNKPPFP